MGLRENFLTPDNLEELINFVEKIAQLGITLNGYKEAYDLDNEER